MKRLKVITAVVWCVSANLVHAYTDSKRGFDFFDHIYTINLPQSKQRKQHMLAEFKRLNIKNYEFFIATDKDSQAVMQLMSSDFVRKYPPCFRCNKTFCKCSNNVLIAPQIGNWLSFINVFKDIIEKNYQYALITEDDVKFNPEAQEIFNALINQENFARYNIDLNKPLIIRFEQRGPVSQLSNEIKFTKKIVMSNACFMVNKLYAQAFLKNLHCIDRTSDMYIQDHILTLDPEIQHFTASPAPTYQLSDHPDAVFYSEIHPKGIDAIDKLRAKNHKKRINYWEYIVANLL